MKRRWVALVCALGLALLWWCAKHTRAPRVPQSTPEDPVQPRAVAPAASARVIAPVPAVSAVRPAIEVRSASLIASIELTPRRPCRGEEVLVQVALRPEAADAKLFVAGQPGNPALLRFAEAGARTLLVTARDWHDRIEQRELPIEVRDCDAHAPLQATAQPLGRGRVLFRALGAQHARFAWDFADGTRVESEAPSVVHDFALRPQERSTSTFLVTLVAQPRAAGRSSTARVAVSFVNADYIAARSGAPTLPVVHATFPSLQDGTASAQLRMRNILEHDLVLERAELSVFACDSRAQPRELTLRAAPLLSRRALRAGAIEEIALDLPLAALGAGACRVQVWLSGEAGGTTVRVPFALELATPDDAAPVTDRALIARLQRATAQLQRERVSAQELLASSESE